MKKTIKIGGKNVKIRCRKMYRIEKFLPEKCPNCQTQLSNKSFSIVMGYIKKGKKVGFKTDGYDIIRCNHCHNITMRIMLEVHQFFDKSIAEKIFKERKFNEFNVVKVYGNMTSDYYRVFYERKDELL